MPSERPDAIQAPLQPDIGGTMDDHVKLSETLFSASESEEVWSYRQSIQIMKELMNGRMFPTTLEGLERAMKALAK